MRKLGWIGALAVLLVAGCTGGSGTEANSATGANTASNAAAPQSDLKVALVTPGEVSDSGWSAMAFEGLKAIESELGAKVANQVATGPKATDAMRSYAQDGYGLVIGHGFEYNSLAAQLGPQFPNTVFVSSSGGEFGKNFGAFRFYLEQGFYLAGFMAGSMTKSGTVAMIGGDKVPSIESTFKAFEAGAKAAKPDVKVITTFTGNGQDVAAARQATLTAISSGADFVIHQANAAAQGVFDAAKEKSVWAFGANLDQNSNASGRVIASAVIVAKPAFVDLAKKVQGKSYTGEISLYGMEQGAIDFVVNPALASEVPADVKAKVDALKADILSGKVTVPKDEF